MTLPSNNIGYFAGLQNGDVMSYHFYGLAQVGVHATHVVHVCKSPHAYHPECHNQPNECSGKQVYDYALAEHSYSSKCVEHTIIIQIEW